ncbi:MAG: CRTAC1 family protein [Planctomycetota bacterium]|nr:CRTAC1 family protein [Planctomycetota bacterium]
MHNRVFTIVVSALATAISATAQFAEVVSPQGFSQVLWSNAIYGSGHTVADFDGDGDLDVVVSPMAGTPFRMFRNDGNLMFTDVSAQSGLGVHFGPHAVEAADIDNDGDQALYVGGALLPARRYINDGTGVFTDEAAARGLTHSDDNYSASFGDFDRDGWLDLYLGNRHDANPQFPGANRLYRNTGGGNFVDVTPAAGCAGQTLTLACMFMDFDEDGWPDLFEVSEKSANTHNEIWRNNGDGTFTPVATQIGANMSIDGMGIDIADAFNDGGVDFYCTDGPPDHLFQVWDAAQQRYVDTTSTFGVEGGGVGWGCNFFDYDNDGWQDLYVVQENYANALFHNPGSPFAAGTPWPNTAAQAGLDQAYTQFTVSICDLDNDGRMDVLQRFHFGISAPNSLIAYHNQYTANNWLKFQTRGRRSNRDGLGTRITLHAGGVTQRQYVRSGAGFLSGNDPRPNFGLGNQAQATLVEVVWPCGQHQYLTNVAANQMLTLVEPTISSTGPAPVGGSSTVTMSVPGDEGLPYMLLLSFSNQVGVALGNQTLPIDFDALTAATLDPLNPFFVGSIGTVDANGDASATLNVPPIPLLSGLTLYAGGLTSDPANFPQARTVLREAVAIPIQ